MWWVRSALCSPWLYLVLGLGITTEVDIITTLEVDPTITLFMLIFTTTTVMQVVLGTGTTVSGMDINITTAGIGTASERWRELPSLVG